MNKWHDIIKKYPVKCLPKFHLHTFCLAKKNIKQSKKKKKSMMDLGKLSISLQK